MIRLENVLKISLQDVLKMSWRRLEDVLKTPWSLDVLKTSSSRRMFAGLFSCRKRISFISLRNYFFVKKGTCSKFLLLFDLLWGGIVFLTLFFKLDSFIGQKEKFAKDFLMRITKSTFFQNSWIFGRSSLPNHWRRSGAFIVNFEHISHLALPFLSSTLSK